MKLNINHINKENFIDIFDTYHKQIFNYVASRTGYRIEIAEDITQDIFLKVWKYRRSYNSKKASIRTWLFIITRNILTDRLRKNKYIQSIVGITQAQLQNLNFEENKAEVLDLIIVLEKLNSKDREYIDLKYKFGFTNKEISRIMRKSEVAVKVRIFRIRKKLEKLFDVNKEY